ncbi:MAG: substrate-binding domain-containing protein [Anaerolineales bacterium]|jgi:putative spermidine/putrescine transport system substrate-binding protein|nr:substrate-binding domain-containing protein [Anaerolineales bacterium]
MTTRKLTRRDFLKFSAVAGGGALLASCGPAATPTPDLSSGATIPMDALVAAVEAEGNTVSVIACPRDWAGYDEIFHILTDQYGLTLNELSPEFGSADELEAIRANREAPGPQAPDVGDIGIGYTTVATDEGLLSPYKVSTWDSIPDNLKHPDGYWFAMYYGVLCFETNTNLVTNVPHDWEDLLRDEYRNMVGMAGDPTASNEAVSTVLAAGLSRTNNDIGAAAQAGLEFWAEMQQAGNFLPVTVNAGTLASGETPIGIEWDYLALPARDTLAGNPPLEVLVPDTGIISGPYAGWCSAYAPHPYGARLYNEVVFSDAGQLAHLKKYAHPARFDDMVARGVIPDEVMASLPPAEYYARAVTLTVEQFAAAKEYIAANWRSVVLGE